MCRFSAIQFPKIENLFRKRSFTMKKLIGVLLTLMFVLAGFGNGVNAQSQVTLLWGMWGSPDEIAVHQKVADAYMAKNPNVKITLWTQAWGDYFTKLGTLLAANDPTT